ncbi:MAG: ferredoxin [Acidimicrobiales bacterium]|jgi:ferredoxin|nr:ferredoxin [Acidimicrobiales bacterium]
MSESELHVKIDSLICEGTGYCVRVVPEVFEIGESGLGEVLQARPPSELGAQLEEASILCPTRAITY